MKDKLTTAVFCIILAAGLILGIALPDKDASRTERRKLQGFPSFSWEKALSGEFSDKFDKYASDQFPLRDALRNMSAFVRLKLMRQRDIDGVFEYNGGIYGIEKSGNEASPERTAAKINSILKELTGCESFVCIIPEKAAFLKDSGLPVPDYEASVSRLKENLSAEAEYIDIWDCLSVNDYYKTDLHWRQERLAPALAVLGEKMGFTADISKMTQNSFYPFYGGYYSRLGLGGEGDGLIYLTSDSVNNAEVTGIEGEMSGVYDKAALSGFDSYDVFLSGAKSIITITAPSAKNGKKLVIFRDSFASSLAPLLLEAQPAYSEITLIDLRYISAEQAKSYIDFSDYDQALFLYSTMIVNNSAMLK